MEAIIMKNQLRWSGHVLRMGDDRLPKQILLSELKKGHRNKGGEKKRYKDVLKANLKKCGLLQPDWSGMACDRKVWHSVIPLTIEYLDGALSDYPITGVLFGRRG